YIRSGRKQYLVGKAAGLLVSGGLTAFLAMVFLLVICILRFGQYPSLIDGNYEMAVLVGRTAVSFLRLFLNGAFWALIGGTSAVITKNRYMSYAVPFILYYVLTVFQERYYQKAFFLSPRYWAASIYYNDIFCIAILAVGSFLTALIFMCAIERRLRYA
ncbi:MAG: ABC transporter permease, partial [Blautia wexlerae]